MPQIDSILENLEIKMVCKNVMRQVISSIEERDPHHLALEIAQADGARICDVLKAAGEEVLVLSLIHI